MNCKILNVKVSISYTKYNKIKYKKLVITLVCSIAERSWQFSKDGGSSKVIALTRDVVIGTAAT